MTRKEAELITDHAQALTLALSAGIQDNLPKMNRELERAAKLRQELLDLAEEDDA